MNYGHTLTSASVNLSGRLAHIPRLNRQRHQVDRLLRLMLDRISGCAPLHDLTGFTLYASDASPEALQDARSWLKQNRLTPDDARLIQTKTDTLVIAKRTPEAWKSNTGS